MTPAPLTHPLQQLCPLDLEVFGVLKGALPSLMAKVMNVYGDDDLMLDPDLQVKEVTTYTKTRPQFPAQTVQRTSSPLALRSS